MNELQALIFDVDGTLADTERDGHRQAFNAAFREAGLAWEWSVALYGELLAVTGGKERIRYYLAHFNRDFSPPGDPDEFIAGLHRRKTVHYLALVEQGAIPLRPGVKRLLAEARREGMRLAIATTSSLECVIALLKSGLGEGAEGWFETIAAGDCVPAKKPAPDIYRLAMEEMGLGPEACLAVEDSANGLQAALGAGIRTLVVTVNGYTCDEDFHGATLVVDHLGDPALPCRVLAGGPGEIDQMDLAFLKRLHREAAAGH